MAATCYLIKKDGEYGSCDERELKYQINNYGAELIGAFKQLSQADVKRRYPRLVKLCTLSGYYAEFEVVYILWAYLYFRNIRQLESRPDLLRWQEILANRHDLKRIFGGVNHV